MADALVEKLNAPWQYVREHSDMPANMKQQALSIWQDLASAEDRVRSDYTGRYPVELLQNAHDACADCGIRGRAWFQLTETALLVANEGVPFDEIRLGSIIRLGATTKKLAQHHTIGYKGIGFTSVFEIADRPQIFSTNVAFEFDRDRATREIEKILQVRPRKVSARAFPFHLSLTDALKDGTEILKLMAEGAVTVIRLPIREDLSVDQIAIDLMENIRPDILLFMPHLESICIRIPGEEMVWQHKEGQAKGSGMMHHLIDRSGKRRSWLLHGARVNVDPKLANALRDELWTDVRKLNVTVGIPWKDGKPDHAREPQPLYVYYPTDDTFGRNILVHGDFYVDSTRKHIVSEGPGGEMSLLVARRAASLIAELASSISEYGNGVLRCLAQSGEPNGYGVKMQELLLGELRESRILRPTAGTKSRRPGELTRLNSGFTPARDKQLAAMLCKQTDILYPGDDAGVQEFLESLGCTGIAPREIANRLSPKNSLLSYEECLIVLGAWIEGREWLNPIGREIIQDVHGKWIMPEDAFIATPDTPQLPRCLNLRVALLPKKPAAREALNRLNVPKLSPAKLVEIALERLREYEYEDRDFAELLKLFKGIWDKNGEVFTRNQNISDIRVPARSRKSPICEWKAAGGLYFTESWTGSSLLERLYGWSGEKLFLDEVPPQNKSKRTSMRKFYETIGVHSKPRIVDIPHSRYSQNRSTESRALFFKWCGSELTDPCVGDHPNSGRPLSGKMIDLLDEIVSQETIRVSEALAEYLSTVPDPFGKECKMGCGHSSHPKRYGNPVKGYQRWLIESASWVPVNGDPEGRTFVPPKDAWFETTQSTKLYLLPRARIREKWIRKLGVVSAANPGVLSTINLLKRLSTNNADLNLADGGVWQTALWLCRKLSAALNRRVDASQSKEECPPLPSMKDGKRVWSEAPLIGDLPRFEMFPGITLLPDGEWSSLRAQYGLKNASEVIKIKSEPVNVQKSSLFSEVALVDLVALISERGADMRKVAYRLGRLDCYDVEELKIIAQYGNHREEYCPTHYLQHHRDSLGRTNGGTLYINECESWQAETPLLARSVANYCDYGELFEPVLLYLNIGKRILSSYGINEETLKEAKSFIQKWRNSPEGMSVEESEDYEEETVSPEEEAPGTSATSSKESTRTAADRVSRANSDQDTNETTRFNSRPPGNATQTSQRKSVDRRKQHAQQVRQARFFTYVMPGASTPREQSDKAATRTRVDKHGVDYVMTCERDAGRVPTEMQHANEGYDIESRDGDGKIVRYIEVKSLSGPWDRRGVTLSRAQHRFAQRSDIKGIVWLYVVENAMSVKPRCHRLQNPTEWIDCYVFDRGWRGIAERTDQEVIDSGAGRFELLHPSVRELLEKVLSAGISVPIIGYELPVHDAWQLEVAWTEKKVAIRIDQDNERDAWLARHGWDCRLVHDWSEVDLLKALNTTT